MGILYDPPRPDRLRRMRRPDRAEPVRPGPQVLLHGASQSVRTPQACPAPATEVLPSMWRRDTTAKHWYAAALLFAEMSRSSELRAGCWCGQRATADCMRLLRSQHDAREAEQALLPRSVPQSCVAGAAADAGDDHAGGYGACGRVARGEARGMTGENNRREKARRGAGLEVGRGGVGSGGALVPCGHESRAHLVVADAACSALVASGAVEPERREPLRAGR